MKQVLEEISLGPQSGRPWYNLDDYIRERDPYEEWDQGFQGREKNLIRMHVNQIISFYKCSDRRTFFHA